MSPAPAETQSLSAETSDPRVRALSPSVSAETAPSKPAAETPPRLLRYFSERSEKRASRGRKTGLTSAVTASPQEATATKAVLRPSHARRMTKPAYKIFTTGDAARKTLSRVSPHGRTCWNCRRSGVTAAEQRLVACKRHWRVLVAVLPRCVVATFLRNRGSGKKGSVVERHG